MASEEVDDNDGKRRRATKAQIKALVDFVEGAPYLSSEASSPGPKARVTAEWKWKEVARDLNKRGPQKSWKQWRQTWKDVKCKTRKRVAQNVPHLAALDEKILNIIGADVKPAVPEQDEYFNTPVSDAHNRNDVSDDDSEHIKPEHLEMLSPKVELLQENDEVLPRIAENGFGAHHDNLLDVAQELRILRASIESSYKDLRTKMDRGVRALERSATALEKAVELLASKRAVDAT